MVLSGGGMGFVDAIKTCFSKYANFNGRARRSEYWFWTLFVVIAITALLTAALTSMDSVDPGGMLTASLLILFCFGTFLPNLAAAVRRLHDSGRSGSWLYISAIPFGVFVVLYFLTADSEAGENDYGPSPKDVAAPIP